MRGGSSLFFSLSLPPSPFPLIIDAAILEGEGITKNILDRRIFLQGATTNHPPPPQLFLFLAPLDGEVLGPPMTDQSIHSSLPPSLLSPPPLSSFFPPAVLTISCRIDDIVISQKTFLFLPPLNLFAFLHYFFSFNTIRSSKFFFFSFPST